MGVATVRVSGELEEGTAHVSLLKGRCTLGPCRLLVLSIEDGGLWIVARGSSKSLSRTKLSYEDPICPPHLWGLDPC